MLANLRVERRPGTFSYVHLRHRPADTSAALAVIEEAEGITMVVPTELAREQRWASVFECAWLTLQIHSSLEAVGLTAAVATALAEHAIACNVISGTFHDHLMVPVQDADRAITVLASLT